MADQQLGKTVNIRSLRKSYGRTAVLHGVDLDIAAGEFCTLLGASGSGKTTILKIIAGFEGFDDGVLLIDGHNIAAIPAAKRNIGMVFQNYALFPHMSVARNVAFGLEMRKLPKAEIDSRVKAVLERVELDAYASRLPGELSGGQQQRVALARALVINPDILLMDEPLGALDKNLRQSIQLQLKQLQRDLGITVIYVTHDQEEALNLSDRIVVMDQGRIAQNASPQELYFRPNSAFVAGFLGECNFLKDENGADFAVRPENLRFGRNLEQPARTVQAKVTSVIFLGSGNKIVAEHASGQIIALVENSAAVEALQPQQTVEFQVLEKDVMRWTA
jgi:ABC-type Fe3+/spermidine/putrescine transport system ATPase subunit